MASVAAVLGAGSIVASGRDEKAATPPALAVAGPQVLPPESLIELTAPALIESEQSPLPPAAEIEATPAPPPQTALATATPPATPPAASSTAAVATSTAAPPPATATPRPPAATPTRVAPPPPAAPVSLSGLEQDMFSRHNSERAKGGLVPLRTDATLVEVARRRASDMAGKGYFSHTSPSGETAFILLGRAGYRYSLAGENIARNNYPDSQSAGVAMTGFMNSPSHRVNVMDRDFTSVGIGAVVAADGMKYYAVVFAVQ